MSDSPASRPGYFVAETRITDPAGMQPYLAGVAGTFRAFGGELVVPPTPAQPLEGTPPDGVAVVLRFPSLAQAQAWYASEAYQAILGHRLASSQGRAYFVEGQA